MRILLPRLKILAILLIALLLSLAPSVLAASSSSNVSIGLYLKFPQPVLVVSSPANGQLLVSWNWDYISPGFFPEGVNQVTTELSTDGLNYL